MGNALMGHPTGMGYDTMGTELIDRGAFVADVHASEGTYGVNDHPGEPRTVWGGDLHQSGHDAPRRHPAACPTPSNGGDTRYQRSI